MQQELPTTVTEAGRLAEQRDAEEHRLRPDRRRADRRDCRAFADAHLRIPLLLHMAGQKVNVDGTQLELWSSVGGRFSLLNANGTVTQHASIKPGDADINVVVRVVVPFAEIKKSNLRRSKITLAEWVPYIKAWSNPTNHNKKAHWLSGYATMEGSIDLVSVELQSPEPGDKPRQHVDF